MSGGIAATVMLVLFLFVFLLIGCLPEQCIISKILILAFKHTPFVSSSNTP